MDDQQRKKIEEQKRIFDAITKAWLDDKFRDFGRFTFKALVSLIGAIIFVLLMKFIFSLHMNDLKNILETTATVHELSQ